MSLNFRRQENHCRCLSFSITTFRTREGKTGGNQNWLHRKDRLSQCHDFFIRQGIPKTRPIISNDNCADIKRSLQRRGNVTIKWRTHEWQFEVYTAEKQIPIFLDTLLLFRREETTLYIIVCVYLYRSINDTIQFSTRFPPKSLT